MSDFLTNAFESHGGCPTSSPWGCDYGSVRHSRNRFATDFLTRGTLGFRTISQVTYPRAHLVDETNGGHYHCISRCVRQSWLCGSDSRSGKSYEHRRFWIARRIKHLAKIFAVDIYAYAIMSNHYHLVLRLDPKRTEQWSDREVARRWITRNGLETNDKLVIEQTSNLLTQPKRILELRERLGSLSWFMRHINEPLARKANSEDECKGRFWEGRFKSVALLDHTALLGCMIYVDLNPARANALSAVPSPHTSARQRQTNKPSFLAATETLGTTTAEYLSLLSWSKPGPPNKRRNDKSVRKLLANNSKHFEKTWLKWIASFSKSYRAYGSKASLGSYTKKLGQSWLQNPLLRSMERDPDMTLNLLRSSA